MKLFAALLLLVLLIPQLPAERYACILALRAGTPELTAENKRFCQELYNLLKEKGFQEKNIKWLSTLPQKGLSESAALTNVRATFDRMEKELKAEDELYLFSVGYLSANPRRVALATTGGRMLGRELAERLDAIPARQFLFLFNTQGASLFEKLAHGTRLVVSATDDAGQLNPPRYPRFFLAEWRKDASSTNWFALLQRTGKAVETFYTQQKIARTENSQFFHNGGRARYPFNEADSRKLTLLFQTSSMTDNARTALAARLPQLLRAGKRSAPDPAAKQLFETAKTAAQRFPGFGAVYTDRNFHLIVNADKSARLVLRESIFIRDKGGAESFARFLPGKGRITLARLLFPDGSRTDFTDNTPLPGRPVRIDGLAPNTLLLREMELAVPVPSHLPDYQQTLVLQTAFPVVRTEVVLESAPPDLLRYKLYNSDLLPRTEHGKTIFTFGAIPAWTSLPFDDAPNSHRIRLLVTTLKSWNDFHQWSARMTDRSGVLDKDAETVLAQLTKNAADDTGKIRAVYDYLCSIRYLTEPVGAGAFRPRTPGNIIRNQAGDCKDKANALVTMSEKLGIPAFRVLLNRMGESDPAFPCWQFNHMLVYLPKLPGYPDGLWLDPTDGSTKFGSLPPGDDGRIGMVLKKSGYEFKKVFEQNRASNAVTETIHLSADSGGRISGTIRIHFSGMGDYRIRHALRRSNPVQKEYLIRSLVNAILKGFRVDSFRLFHLDAEQSHPLELEAKVRTDSRNFVPSDLIAPGGLDRYFIAEKRDHTLLLENGVPFTYTQKLEFRNVKLPEIHWKQENAWLSAEILSGDSRRTIRIIIKNPHLPPSAYGETRELVTNFNIQLKQWRTL